MTRADAHIHLFAGGYPGRYGRSPAGTDELAAYEDIRRVHGIDQALVIGYEGGAEFVGNNDHLATLAGRHAWIRPVAYVPPTGPATLDDLHLRREQGFVGLSAYLPGPVEAAAVSAWSPGSIDQLNRDAAILSLNATPAATAVLAGALAALDGCTVLFSHLGLPGPQATPPTPAEAAELLEPLLALAGLPHVGVKVSGLYAISQPGHAYPHTAAVPFLDLLLDRFGPTRLYWGSDFAPSLDVVSFAQTLDVAALDRLTQSERDAVFGGNLQRILPS